MKEEIRQIGRRVEDSRSRGLIECEVLSGRIGQCRVTVATTGDGAKAATRGLEALLNAERASALVVVGVAGALSPDLENGNVVICQQVRDDNGRVFDMDAGLIAKAKQFQTAKVGSTLSVGRIASTVAEKQGLWHGYGSLASQVVDLESSSYVELARQRDIPCLVLRVVSDGPDESLPLDFNRFRNSDGGVDRGRVLRQALRHPTLMPKLLRLRDRVQTSALLLDRVVAGMFES
jgi:nucleoside phosphorylase